MYPHIKHLHLKYIVWYTQRLLAFWFYLFTEILHRACGVVTLKSYHQALLMVDIYKFSMFSYSYPVPTIHNIYPMTCKTFVFYWMNVVCMRCVNDIYASSYSVMRFSIYCWFLCLLLNNAQSILWYCLAKKCSYIVDNNQVIVKNRTILVELFYFVFVFHSF